MATYNVDIQNVEQSVHYISVTGTVNGQQVAAVLRIPIVAEALKIDAAAIDFQISAKSYSEALNQIMGQALVGAFKNKVEEVGHPGALVITEADPT